MKVIAAPFNQRKMNLWGAMKNDRHPVHLIEGGAYLTEDDRQFDVSLDVGWFWLNQKDYDYFKSQLREIDI